MLHTIGVILRFLPISLRPATAPGASPSRSPAHLLPKLRCEFAEFLSQPSHDRLGIFSPPTCVGLRYGHPSSYLRAFSWKHGITQFTAAKQPPHHLSALPPRLILREPPTGLNLHPIGGWAILLRQP